MKKNILKFVKLICLSVLAISLLSACNNNQSPVSGDPEKQTLVMGLDDTFAPMGFRDEKGELTGFDIDLAKALADELGINIKFQPIDWSMKEAELDAKNIDLIWNGYSITDDRKEKVAFSKSYLSNKQIIVTLSESNIESKKDLADKVIAVQAESSALKAVKADEGFMKTNPTLVEFSTNNEAFMDLEAKRSVAIVVDEVLARYYIKQKDESNYTILKDHFGEEEYAIGIRKDDTELLEKVNSGLDELVNNGTYDILYVKWFSEN